MADVASGTVLHRMQEVMKRHTEIRQRLDGAEPAAKLLPEDEFWSPRTWAHFRYAVLAHLGKEGAHTLDELAESPPEILGLPLSRAELAAALESARRRRLVERLDGGLGPVDAAGEWVLTEHGKDLLRHGASDVERLAQGAIKHGEKVRSIGPILVAYGAGIVLDSAVWGLAILAAFLLVSFAWTAVRVGKRRSGVTPGTHLATDWTRWGLERHDLFRMATRPFPWKWLIAAVGAFAVVTVAVGSFDPLVDHELLGALLLAIAWLPFIPVLNWTTRWSDIASEARHARVREAFARSSLATP